jgi:hypothetical protein
MASESLRSENDTSLTTCALSTCNERTNSNMAKQRFKIVIPLIR